MDHAPPPGTIIDAWLDGLSTRVATGHRVALVLGGEIYLDQWDGERWIRGHSIPDKASWRVARDPMITKLAEEEAARG